MRFSWGLDKQPYVLSYEIDRKFIRLPDMVLPQKAAAMEDVTYLSPSRYLNGRRVINGGRG